MAQIRMTPEELQTGAENISKLSEEISLNLTNLKQIVDTVTNNWEGAAQSSYVELFNQIHTEFEKTFPPTVLGLSQQMKAAADAIEQTDAEIAKAFSGK